MQIWILKIQHKAELIILNKQSNPLIWLEY